jgi:hypothetical protein
MLFKTMLLCAAALTLHAQFPVELAALRYVDLAEGTGAPAAEGKRFTVMYTGWLKNDTQFDASKAPFSFVQGRRQVIVGWDIGFEGMKVGGKRKLFIPWQLAYGEAGSGPIPPKADLIFDVELLAVSDVPALLPALDVMLPYLDLESKVVTLARSIPDDRFGEYAKIFLHIVTLNQSIPDGVAKDAPVASGKQEILGLLTSSFAAVRTRLVTARNGFLSGDATLNGKPTTQRGLFVALDEAIGEAYGRAAQLAALPVQRK